MIQQTKHARDTFRNCSGLYSLAFSSLGEDCLAVAQHIPAHSAFTYGVCIHARRLHSRTAFAGLVTHAANHYSHGIHSSAVSQDMECYHHAPQDAKAAALSHKLLEGSDVHVSAGNVAGIEHGKHLRECPSHKKWVLWTSLDTGMQVRV
eukprot:2775467-Pleurochrysis_carterae.AAC.2